MSLTLGLTGMDPDTEVALKIAFAEVNERLDKRWKLVPETDADHIVVDMDSMYGPMSWLRLHAAGKTVIGLSSAERTQTEFRLGRPFDAHQVYNLLTELEEHAQADSSPGGLPTPDSAVPGETRTAADTGPASGADAPPLAPSDAPDATDSGDPEQAEVAVPEPPREPGVPARDPVFADWMRPGALPGRVRYRRGDGPTLLIDPAAQTWHGPTALKTVAPVIEGTVEGDAFEPLDDDQWASQSAATGEAQPLLRLAWLAGLVAGRGALLPEHDADGRYALTKWPQTEREYPKHFRIATAMMKGQATVTEIAEASGVPVADVADFINANLVTGFAQHVPEPSPEPVEPPKPASLMDRLRKR